MRTKVRIPLILLVVCLILAGAWVIVSPARSQQQSEDQLTGPDLADAMGLKVEERPEDCNSWYTVEGQSGYCLDGKTNSDVELWELVHRLRGTPPTDLEKQSFMLRLEMMPLMESDSASDKAKLDDLEAELKTLNEDAQAGN